MKVIEVMYICTPCLSFSNITNWPLGNSGSATDTILRRNDRLPFEINCLINDCFKFKIEQACIPVGCVPTAAVAVSGGGSPPGSPWTRHTPRDQAPPTRHPPGP